tara:strand:- start:600 stop:1190 length:591 start_codon:yes stop_codon:yes gene_type:complete
MSTIAIVGLGNPGLQYEDTRHNAGFWMLEAVAGQNNCSWKESRRFHSLTTTLKTWSRPALLVKPLTFVNESGSYLKPLLKYHDCRGEEMIVIHDDVAFESGQFKISVDKGDGGHKGINDVIRNIGPRFVRFRLGVGEKSSRMSMSAYVLGKFSPSEQAIMSENFDFFVEALQRIVDKGVAHAMNLSNKRKKTTHGQ